MMAITYTDAANSRLMNICPPKGSNRAQLVAVFANFANRHPEKLHKRWFTVALEALLKHFRASKLLTAH